MTRFGLGWLCAVAFATVACATGTRPAKASAGTTAPSTAERQATPAGAASQTSGSAAAPTRVVVGRVELIDRANEVTLSGTEGVGLGFDKFKIAPDTQVTVNGQRATAAEVNPGDEVRASFSGKDDDAHLVRIEVLPSPGK
jgi:hypothetical protein